MTAYTGAPSLERREGGQLFILAGNPPIWGARVRRVSREHWRVTYQGPGHAPREEFSDSVDALQRASRMVGMLVGEWWRARMSGAQRIMIGRDRLCPMRVTGDHVAHLCGQPPDTGSVWCEAHPWGQT